MKLLEKGYIYQSQPNPAPRRVCTFPSLCRIASGKILAAFQVGSAKNAPDTNCMVAESSDAGTTWRVICERFEASLNGKAGHIGAPQLAEVEPGRLMAFLTWFDWSGRRKSMYDATTDNILPTRLLLVQSSDGGATWDSYRVLDTGEYRGCSGTGPLVRLANGEWLLPFESYAHRGDGVQAVHTAGCVITRDGESASPVATIAEDPQHARFYWDQRLAYSHQEGRPLAMFWTYERRSERDLSIHIAQGAADGRTWEEPRPTGIRGQIATPIPLPDGRLLASYVHRHPPGSIRLVASEDKGASWDIEREISIYESHRHMQPGMDGKSDYAQYWEDMSNWTFGHPDGIVLDEKSVLLAYYAGSDVNCLSACWARVQV